MKKIALVTGITGQDGSHLAELLLEKGYTVYGLIRRSTSRSLWRIDQLTKVDDFKLVEADLTDQGSLTSLISSIRPHEVYNLAAQSFVELSWKQPRQTSEVTALGVLNVLEAIRVVDKSIKFAQASSSEMYGNSPAPQSETTPFHPISPYAVAKLFGHWITVNYRQSYGMFCSTSICFNHEGPRRGVEFVTRKITSGLAKILAGGKEKIKLGNLDARRDWGYAGDYVRAMWMILQHNQPDDFVVGTGISHSVREFLEEAFSYAGLKWSDWVVTDPQRIRPMDVPDLVADCFKIRDTLGWRPEVDFRQLVRMMVNADRDLNPPPNNK